MARQLATKELVFEAASMLASNGVDPSIVAVQEHIGGGSYTTIKRYLDEWVAQQALNAQTSVETPGFVMEKGAELARTLWAMASREAQKDTQAAKDAAVAQVASISKELEFAQNEIRRLEEIEESQRELLERTQLQLSEADASLVDARVQAAKAPDLETRLAAAQAELAAARQDATARAVEVGRLAGEANSLRDQVRDLTTALVSLKASPSAGE